MLYLATICMDSIRYVIPIYELDYGRTYYVLCSFMCSKPYSVYCHEELLTHSTTSTKRHTDGTATTGEASQNARAGPACARASTELPTHVKKRQRSRQSLARNANIQFSFRNCCVVPSALGTSSPLLNCK